VDFTTADRKKLAHKGLAMGDGSYPIRNVGDLQNAISAYGRSKHPTQTRAWIKKRAMDLGRKDLIPMSWL
jgi:hypothetical protein